MSMMGEMTFFLGLQVKQSPCGIFINQSKYVLEILNKYQMKSCDPVGTPMEIKDKLDLDQNGTPVDATKYRSMTGTLMYLMSSRPDTVHATCLCARYQAKPTERHLKEVKRIFRYLRGTINTGLWYTKDFGFELTGFSDADYAGSLSTAKAKYVSLSACCAQVLWMRTQLTDYGFHFNKIPIYCDSKSAISISCNPVQHSRTKHIAICYYFIKEHVKKGTIELYFVKTDYQLADIFTKALPADHFNYLVRRLGFDILLGNRLERSITRIQQVVSVPITTVTNISTKFLYLKKGEYDICAMKMQNFISSFDLLCWNIILKGKSAKSMTTDNDGNLKILPPVTAEEHQQQKGHFSRECRAQGGQNSNNYLKYKSKEEGKDGSDSKAMEKQELMTKLDNEIANQAKRNNSGKNLYKLIDSSISVRTKRGLGLDKYIGEGELGIDDSKVSIFHTNSDELEGQPIYNRFASVDHMKAVPPPLTGNYMPPSNIPDIDESQMVYRKEATNSSKIKTNDDNISHSNNSVLFDFSDRSSKPSTNDLQTCDSRENARFDKKLVKCFNCKQMGHFLRECRAQGGQNSNNYHKYKSKEAGKDGSDLKAMVVVDGSIDWDKQTEEGNTEPRSLGNFSMVAGIEIASDANSKGGVVYADNVIPDGVFVSAGNVAAAVVSPQSETEFALMGNYMPPSNIPDINESQMVYGKKVTGSSEIKTNDDSISYSNDSVLFYFSDRSSEPSTNDHQMCDSSVKCSRPNHSDHDSTDSISSVSAPASESKDTIVIDYDRQEDFTSVCSIETYVKSSKTLCNKFRSFNKESHFRKHKSVASKSCYVCGSYLHLIKDCDLHEQRFAKRNTEGNGILGRRPTGKPVNPNRPKPVFAGQQNPVSAGPPNPVSAGQQNPVSAGPPNLVSAGQQNPVSAGLPNLVFSEQQNTVSAGQPNPVFAGQPNPVSAGDATLACNSILLSVSDNSIRLEKEKDRGIVDSGCSRSISGNKDELENFEDFDGGEVTFGGSTGKISGKGTIKTKTLNFENVLYVEEL
nr:copia protein [Tanacetum cinerariifolium]